MKNLVYTVALILIIAWLIGFFAFHYGAIIHVLPVIAIVLLVMTIFGERKVVK